MCIGMSGMSPEERDRYSLDSGQLERRVTEYMVFEPDVPKPNTKVWRVLSKRHGDVLGYVKWYAPWRQYCFWPEGITLSSGCMRDIEDFLVQVNDEHREMLRKRRLNR
jgi:hypothetical protein